MSLQNENYHQIDVGQTNSQESPSDGIWHRILATLCFIGGGGLIFSGVTHFFIPHAHYWAFITEAYLIIGGISAMAIETRSCFGETCSCCTVKLELLMACLTKVSGRGFLYIFLGALNCSENYYNIDLYLGGYLIIVGILCVATGRCGLELLASPKVHGSPYPLEDGIGAYQPPVDTALEKKRPSRESNIVDPIRVIFNLVDHNGDGKIGLEEFVGAVEQTRTADMTRTQIEKLFWSIQTKEKGLIDYKEFKSSVTHIEIQGGDIFRGLIEHILAKWLEDYAGKYSTHADVPHDVKVAADDAWKLLMDGNARYIHDDHTAYILSLVTKVRNHDLMRFSQNPYAIILCCADSRVQPSLFLEAGPGEIFVIRTAGNVADTSVIASIEYAVEHLGTKLLLVCGHQRCGAVTAAMGYKLPKKPSLSDLCEKQHNIHDILSRIYPACIQAKEDHRENRCKEEEMLDRAIRYNVQNVAEEIKNNSPIIQEALEHGNFQIREATYLLDTGAVVAYEE